VALTPVQFSESDQLALARLRRYDRRWRYMRWLYLVWAALLVGVGLYLEVTAARQLSELTSAFPAAGAFQGSTLFIAFLASRNATIGQLMWWAGVFLGIFIIGRWRGSPERRLLLMLLE
jgi:uncharacterized membrane protein SpoIIM required for sporulation